MIYQCKSLTYLDQRPIRDQDRLLVEAWKVGGLEAERALKEQLVAKEHERMHQSVLNLMRFYYLNDLNPRNMSILPWLISRIRNENLAKRGIDSSDEAQLKAVEDRGRELLEQVKKTLTGSEMESRDNTLLDPLLKSINLCMENEDQGLPLLPDPDVLRDAMKHSSGPVRKYMEAQGRNTTDELDESNKIVEQKPEDPDQIFLDSLQEFAKTEHPVVEVPMDSAEPLETQTIKEETLLEIQTPKMNQDEMKSIQEEPLDVIHLESLDPNQAPEGRCPITGKK